MLARRSFLKVSAAAIGGASIALASSQTRRAAGPVRKPRKLSAGDTVGLVLPASMAFEADSILMAQEQLEAIGFKVKLGKYVFEKHGYFAGTDRHRAEDVNAMFADPSVHGVFCYTGGWGSPRVLPLLDYDLIGRRPKVFVGYSDITGLLNPIHQRTGLVTFHGPVAASNISPYTLENFRRTVMSTEPIGVLSNPPKKETELVNRSYRITRLKGGKATGRIAGGNLSLIAALMGTPYQIDTDGAILFLEDIHEAPYRIDRMLTQLWLGGQFERIAGFVFGRCTDCDAVGPSFSLEELLRERAGQIGVPAISGFAFGHIEEKLTLPIGLTATLDADAGTVEIREAAVTDES